MKLLIKRIIFVFLISFLNFVLLTAQSREEARLEKEKEKILKWEQKAYDKYRKKVLKHRFEMQTREVQKRMKKSRKISDHFNRKGSRPLLKRIFKKSKCI